MLNQKINFTRTDAVALRGENCELKCKETYV